MMEERCDEVRGRERQRLKFEGTLLALKLGKGDHEPWNLGGLQELDKARKRILP